MPVLTVNLQEALISLYKFLCIFNAKCVLAAHNYSFDYPRLIKAIDKTFMDKYFSSIVFGFVDTIPAIKKITGLNKRGQNKLEFLAQNLKIEGFNAHDALGDVCMLSKIIEILHISDAQLIQSCLKWDCAKEKVELSKKCKSLIKTLDIFKSVISAQIRKKIIASNIDSNMIIEACKS